MLIKKVKSYISSHKKICIFLDYDGTLTEIQKLPELAVLDKDVREILEKLKQKYTLGIVSGRALNDVKSLVKVDGIFYSGNHGLEIEGENLTFYS
jgi:trehalose 6-phosphate phosphatase